jgi:hypothetical protein
MEIEPTDVPAPTPARSKSERFSGAILWYEGFGFAMIIVLTWLDDLLNLPYHLFGGSHQSHWRSSLLQTEVVLLVWFVVHHLTSRVLARLHYLERMLRMCAWCRKINDGEEWVPLEQYFSTRFDTRTSHGMCPECAETMRAEFQPPGSGPATE